MNNYPMDTKVMPVGIIQSNVSGAMAEADLLRKNALAESINKLFDPKIITMIADLNSDEVKLCTRLEVLSSQLGNGMYETVRIAYLKHGLSRKRQSRKEVINFAAGIMGKKGFGEKLKGLFKSEEGV